MPPDPAAGEPDHPSTDERNKLTGFLDHYRAQVVTKVDGLSAEQARWRPAETANSLAAIVNHLAYVEHWWFHEVFLGKPCELPEDPDDGDFDFRSADTLPLAEIVERYASVCERSRAIVAEAPSLDEPCVYEKYTTLNLRWVLIHMLEETARHAGHMDITRELIDGTVRR